MSWRRAGDNLRPSDRATIAGRCGRRRGSDPRQAGRPFDAALARIRSTGITYYAGPHHQRPGEINHLRGVRGVYFDDPDGHTIEITTQPYGIAESG
jgi:catechol 2,3-dioxygenase-like lactoylglutathione lyase family enzyme